MLTPVDIQQKKFRTGLGYEKKDVNAFFEVVADSYEKLYRSNAELKEKVLTLTDGLQNYKSKEAELEKSIMIAEKDSEDKKSKAQQEAKNIKLDAKNKAKNILADAEKKLAEITQKITELETQYAAYKSNFVYFMKKQFEQLGVEDFDPKSYIDERSLQTIGVSGSSSSYKSKSSGPNMPFGSFEGDPQMRDESTLGGFNGSSGGMSMNPEDRVSTSAVYTSNLSAGENFVDPFNPDANKNNGRYNPYDGRTVTDKKKGTSSFTVNKDGMGSGKYSSRYNSKNTQSRKTGNTQASANKSTSTGKPSEKTSEKKSDPAPEKKSYDSAKADADAKIKDMIGSKVSQDKVSESKTKDSASISTSEEKPKKSVVDNIFTFEKDVKPTAEAKTENETKVADDSKSGDASEDIPTLNFGDGDVEVETVKESNLLGDGDDGDGDGFEFV